MKKWGGNMLKNYLYVEIPLLCLVKNMGFSWDWFLCHILILILTILLPHLVWNNFVGTDVCLQSFQWKPQKNDAFLSTILGLIQLIPRYAVSCCRYSGFDRNKRWKRIGKRMWNSGFCVLGSETLWTMSGLGGLWSLGKRKERERESNYLELRTINKSTKGGVVSFEQVGVSLALELYMFEREIAGCVS